MILIDSDVLIEHLRGKTEARDWLVRVRQSSGPLAISVVSLTEVVGGCARPSAARSCDSSAPCSGSRGWPAPSELSPAKRTGAAGTIFPVRLSAVAPAS
ncbi:MAG: hypothetical protein ACRDOI_02200 [Trebonia sp.]